MVARLIVVDPKLSAGWKHEYWRPVDSWEKPGLVTDSDQFPFVVPIQPVGRITKLGVVASVASGFGTVGVTLKRLPFGGDTYVVVGGMTSPELTSTPKLYVLDIPDHSVVAGDIYCLCVEATNPMNNEITVASVGYEAIET